MFRNASLQPDKDFERRYLSEKLLSVLGSAFAASSRIIMGATHEYRTVSRAAWEQYSAQHPEVSGLLQGQVSPDDSHDCV